MTDSTCAITARTQLDDLMARVGVDGLVAAMSHPGMLAAVDQHAAAVRESLRAAGKPVDAVSLAGYARSILALLDRCGHELPEPDRIDWARAGAPVLRLVAICGLADAVGCL
jgi:hypothetical protein